MNTLGVLMAIFSLFMILLTALFFPWKPISWLYIAVHAFCVVLNANLVAQRIERTYSMKKHVCDLCRGELHIKKESYAIVPGLGTLVEFFKATPVYKVVKFSVIVPFSGRREELDICSKCMNDFAEFVQKKKSYFDGEKP